MPSILLRLARLLPLVLGSMLLMSCGGGGGDSDATAAAPTARGDVDNYLAMADGNRWLYSSTAPDGLTLPTESLGLVRAATLLDGRSALLWRDYFLDSGAYISTYVSLTDRHFRYLLDSDSGMPYTSLPVLRLPLRSGDSYVAYALENLSSGSDVDGDGVHETYGVRLDVTVGPMESVTVPLGTFTALKVTTVGTGHGTYSLGGTWSTTTTNIHWYAKDIGLVKAISTTGLYSHVRELTGYRVAGVSTDTTLPTVTGTTPAAGASSAPVVVTATFSEAMDPETLTAATFVVRNADGDEVSGAVSVAGRTAIFAPDTPLAAGTYSATLQGATDALGNALASPYVWSFTIVAPPA